MIEYRKYIPYSNLPIRVRTKYGVSEAILSEVGYRYTNLTHPLQNAHLSHFDIIEWEYVDEKNIEELQLNVYFARGGVNSFLYEDHGDTFAFEQGIYVEKKFVVNGNDEMLTITQRIVGLYTVVYEQYDCKVIGVPFQVNKVTIDDKELTSFTTDSEGVLHFKANKNFTAIKIFSHVPHLIN